MGEDHDLTKTSSADRLSDLIDRGLNQMGWDRYFSRVNVSFVDILLHYCFGHTRKINYIYNNNKKKHINSCIEYLKLR